MQKMHKQEAQSEAGKPGVVTIATNMAGRGTDIKLSAEVKPPVDSNKERERHDRATTLRGRRTGRSGKFSVYVSLEDNLMRLFGSERVAK
jgi:preprotein translocase subunit SecA